MIKRARLRQKRLKQQDPGLGYEPHDALISGNVRESSQNLKTQAGVEGSDSDVEDNNSITPFVDDRRSQQDLSADYLMDTGDDSDDSDDSDSNYKTSENSNSDSSDGIIKIVINTVIRLIFIFEGDDESYDVEDSSTDEEEDDPVFKHSHGFDTASSQNFKDKLMGMLNHGVTRMVDADAPLYANSVRTKGKFAEDMANTFDSFNLPISARDSIMACLQKHAGAVLNLPVKITKSSLMKDTSSYYVEEDYRALQIGICEMGCMAFIDENESLRRCTVCDSERFTHCSHRHCKEKSYDDCTHCLKNQTPKKVVHYRPFLPLLKDLLQYPKFRQALMYCEKKMEYRSEILTDVLDGFACRKLWDDMDDRYHALPNAQQQEYQRVSMLLSYFFDGANIFDRQNSRFHALLVTFLNLHPSLRVSHGLGMFLTAINTSFAQVTIFLTLIAIIKVISVTCVCL